MAPKTPPKATPKKNDTSAAEKAVPCPTTADVKLLDSIFKQCPSKNRPSPSVNWRMIAEQLGYSNANTAQTRYGQVLRKYHWFQKDESDSPKKSVPERPTAKRALSPVSDDEEDVKKTPKKRNARRSVKKESPKVKSEFGGGGGIQDSTSDGGEWPSELIA
ncbi:hypothetical protein F4819DRAFT_474950 [Hypoxylon fuscum]|nr:hypothetical protein F4819DRAFT_474950 [Hypoxylon fuscum]